jgi:4-hydroxybutyrate dehydrogenase
MLKTLPYKPFMEQYNLACTYVFQEKFGVGEPSEAMIETMYEAIPYDSYDRVIAIGGGAIMDLCKLLGCKRPSSVHELYFKREPVIHEKEVIAIPTTCGTGSEVTNISVAIVKDEKNGVLTGGETKLGLVSDDIIPNKVCLIPDMLKTLPYKPFAASAIDALIHATESYLSPARKTTTSEMYSIKAMEMILKGFVMIGENGPDARLEYLDEYVTASLYAGVAFLKAGCATVHAMSFPLGGTYHVPHGESNYALFGKILEIYDEINPDGELANFKALVGRILGCDAKDAISALNALLEKVLPLKPLKEYGFKESDIKDFPVSVMANQQRLITNSYVPMNLELLERIYAECF